jgi:hypothetical protein
MVANISKDTEDKPADAALETPQVDISADVISAMIGAGALAP